MQNNDNSSSPSSHRMCKICKKNKPLSQLRRRKIFYKKINAKKWTYDKLCKRCALAKKKLRYHNCEKTRNYYKIYSIQRYRRLKKSLSLSPSSSEQILQPSSFSTTSTDVTSSAVSSQS